MKRLVIILSIVGMVLSWPIKVLAAPADHIVISEVQTGSATDTSQEFVELYNPTDTVQVLDNWTLEYGSSTGATWTKKATLSGSIPAYGFYLLATASYITADNAMSSGLASSGGHVRIKDTAGSIIDLVGWGSAAHPEGMAVAAPLAGGSIERTPGRLNALAGNSEDTDNNAVDFVLREVAEPQTTAAAIEDPSLAPVEIPVEAPEPNDDGEVIQPTYLPIYITEALPDPASPLTDARDEFIELYNPNDVAVNLKGYTIRTGTNLKSYYTIGDVTILSGAYMSFYSVDTKLGLTNSGGAVQLLDPLGLILDVTDTYGTAKVGQAWADINGVWAWTLEPTPGAANVLVEAIKTTSSSAKATTKKTTTKKTAAKKATKKKTSKAASKKTKAKSTKTSLLAATSGITDPSPVAKWLLIAAGCFTIVYALYGFRHDIYNHYIKTKRDVAAWLSRRSAMPWRRDDRVD